MLINNAGVSPNGLFGDEEARLSRLVIDVNVGGVITGTRLALDRFLPNAGGARCAVAARGSRPSDCLRG